MSKKYKGEVILIILFLFPVIFLGIVGLSGEWMYPKLLPSSFSLRAFELIFISEPQLGQAIGNSLFIAFFSTLVCLGIALPAAKVLASQTFVSAYLLNWLIYVPLLLPAVALITALQTTLIQWHLTETYLGVILIHSYFSLPYAMQLLLPAYRKLGCGYEQTAQTLGANRWQQYMRITFPLMKPSIAAASSMTFIISLSQYLPTFFIGGGKIITLPLLLLPYAQNGRYQMAAAYSLVFLGVSLIGTGIIQKSLSLIRR